MDTVWLSVAAFLAAALSGSVGFGGALLLLPVLTASLGSESSVPVLTLIQIISNAARVVFGAREIDWRAVKMFLITAVPFSVIGAVSFISSPKEIMMKVIGVSIIVLLMTKLLLLKNLSVSYKCLPWAGVVVGFISGLIGTAGPLGAVAFLSLNLSAVSYISTDAFASLVMHTVKAIVYRQHQGAELATISEITIAMSAATIFGTFIGNKVAEKLPKVAFQRIAIALLIVTSLQLILNS